MTWLKTDLLLKRRLNQKGLGSMVDAGSICQKAEGLYPELFKAVSFRNATLHLELERRQALPLKLIEGKLLEELNQFTQQQKLPKVQRIRLTYREGSATL